HGGNMATAGQVFGMGKTSAVQYIWQVVNVLNKKLALQFIQLPATEAEWQDLEEGFEEVCGFPGACLAVDGSLFEIERPHDFQGWYCRKGYPAINVQIV